ncbi:MAG: hypothetical protein HY711_05400 [Candidatus Melainabacteria bacterium]|nr:hypothetical protein [Candidatus Melainabacteria bacterium]
MLNTPNNVQTVFVDNLQSFADTLKLSVDEMSTALEASQLSESAQMSLNGRLRKLEGLLHKLTCVEQLVPRLLGQLDSLMAYELVRTHKGVTPQLCFDEGFTTDAYKDFFTPFMVPVNKPD